MSLASCFSAPPPGFTGEVKVSEPLSRYSFYQIGGPAAVFAVPKTLDDLRWIWSGVIRSGARFFLLGAGSNLLFSDEGFDGVVIRLGKLNPELSCEGAVLKAGASVMLSTLLRRAAQEGWGGLEFLAGIPGSVGGAVRMNAGTHLGETQSRLIQVEAVLLRPEAAQPLEKRIYEQEDLKFQYRRNLFLPAAAVVWSTRWRIDREEPAKVRERLDATLVRRKQTQPIDYPSCGSVFKNPRESGLSAWQVLDRLGLRGRRIGGAQISEKHSNFIVNLGGAKARDVRELIELARARAKDELGIELQEEVIFVD